MEFLHLGELNGPATARLADIALLWENAGFNVKTFDDIHRVVWEKLVCNVCFSGTCAITEMTIGEIMADENAWQVASGCAREAFDVALARGIRISFDDPVDHVYDFGTRIPEARPSMLLDHIQGRRSEIDVINGAIPVEGGKVGVPTPFNTTVSALVRAKERRMGLYDG
jgi:2-dehydropantoate 2-reductase